MTLSRRDFLKLAGGGVGAAALLNIVPGRIVKAAGGLPAVSENVLAKGVLYDSTICVGCRSCEAACKKANDLPPDTEHPETLTADTYTRIRATTLQVAGKDRPVYVKLQCMHCLHPACVEACIVGALKKTPEGPVAYDRGKCIGCRYCMVACPFGVPNYQWDSAIPWVTKCTFCAERQAQGLGPACVTACPTKALKFGVRADLLAEARQRIAAAPTRYVNYIYGENEVGGTSWLYLSPVPFSWVGFKPHILEPVTVNAARAMGLVPPVLLGVAATMTGVYWLTKRQAMLKEKANGGDKGGENK